MQISIFLFETSSFFLYRMVCPNFNYLPLLWLGVEYYFAVSPIFCVAVHLSHPQPHLLCFHSELAIEGLLIEMWGCCSHWWSKNSRYSQKIQLSRRKYAPESVSKVDCRSSWKISSSCFASGLACSDSFCISQKYLWKTNSVLVDSWYFKLYCYFIFFEMIYSIC